VTRRARVTAGPVAVAVAVVVSVVACCSIGPGATRVASASTTVDVSTDPTGAHVRLARRGVWIEVREPRDGSGSTGSAGDAGGCRRRWVPTQYPHHLSPGPVDPDIHVTPMPERPGAEYVAYHVYCGTTYLDSVWLAPSAFAAAAPVVDVRAIAEQLARDLPYPAVSVGISPDGRGLTGLESWFWVSGYSGPVRDAFDGLGVRVEVEAVPASVRWSFGDGTPTRPGTLGQAAPARSDVVHTYERRSTAGPMTVRASVQLDVRFRVDGGAWEALDPVLRTATRGYPVAESRAALVAPR
jgi:hypothetical protein